VIPSNRSVDFLEVMELRGRYLIPLAFLTLASCTFDDEIIEELDSSILPVDCDTSNYDYNTVIYPLIQNQCSSTQACHGAGSVFGEITTFENITSYVDNGSFEKRVLIDQDMPPAAPLSDCDQELIRSWLTKGAPGNNDSDPPDPDPVLDTGDCDPDVIYFGKDVLPILQSNCALSGCHDANTAEDGFDFSTYEGTIKKDFKPGDPEDSEMYEVLVEDDHDDIMPPPPMDPLSAEQIQIIYDWIIQGGEDLSCDPGSCNTEDVTFSGVVLPIIENKCKGCHSGTAPQGNVLLTNYDQTKALVDDGSLMGTLNNTGGYAVMPPAGKLPDCEIQQIEAWVNNGASNN